MIEDGIRNSVVEIWVGKMCKVYCIEKGKYWSVVWIVKGSKI